jgi:hypothetical protein
MPFQRGFSAQSFSRAAICCSRVLIVQKNLVASEMQRGGSNVEALQRISSSMDAGLN